MSGRINFFNNESSGKRHYQIVYGLLEKGIFTPNITFICIIFGFGMVVHLGCSTLCVKFLAVLEF